MAILWCGGEDIDFANGTVPGATTDSTYFRSTWARCATNGGGLFKGTAFPGGAITSAWLHINVVPDGSGASGSAFVAGFGKLGTNSYIGIAQAINNTQTLLVKVDSGTMTTLATLSGGLNGRYSIQLLNYGSSGTINLYSNNSSVLIGTYTGNLSLTGITGFDAVFLNSQSGSGGNSGHLHFSEAIVSDTTTLAMQGLCTLAPTGNGTTQNWSNPAYTNFNPTTINDLNATFTNTTGQDEQAAISGSLPTGTALNIQAVKIVARGLATAGATAANLKLGFNNTNNSTVAVNPQHSMTTSFAPVEDYFDTDPTNGGAAWGSSLTGYQINLRSA